MAINKITPRALDKATDYKLVPATAFIDAVNVSLTEDESNEGDDGGDRGVIKNVKGNTSIRFYRQDDVIADGDYKVIGTTVDRKLKLVYIYVYHSILAEQGVWVYDKDGVLSLPQKYREQENPSGVDNDGSLDASMKDTIKCVAKGPFFNFKQHSVVQGNVVYGNSLNIPVSVEQALSGAPSDIAVTSSEREIFEKSIHLYFTDDTNEPKKVDVTASMFARGTSSEAFNSANGGYYKIPDDGNELEQILYAFACRPTPLSRPRFDWDQDVDSDVSNFEKSEGFKFAYQIVFSDGTVSAISPKSELAVTPSLIFQGTQLNPEHKKFNICRVFISDEYINRDSDDSQLNYIKQINLLAQEGDGPYKIVKEIGSSDAYVAGETSEGVTGSGSTTSVVVDFKNDVIGIPIADSEENKYFDSVPQKAEGQAVVDNRLMYGNYVEGYPTPEFDATLTIKIGDSLDEEFSGGISIRPSVSREIEQHSNAGGDGVVLQHMTGFRITIDDDAFPEVSQGSIVDLRLKIVPTRNFHLYNATNSYHQSRKIGEDFVSGQGEAQIRSNMLNANNFSRNYVSHKQAGSENLMPGISPGTRADVKANDTSDYYKAFHAFKNNQGVARVTWSRVDTFNWTGESLEGANRESFLGTSAAHPFVIPGNLLDFKISFECLQAAEGDVLREAFFDLMDELCSIGGGDNQQSTYNPSTMENEYFKVVTDDTNVYSEFEWDIDSITHGAKFDEGSGVSKLISMVANTPNYSNAGGTNPVGLKCRGGVVAKKGKATFGLRKSEEVYGYASPGKRRDYKIFLDSIPNEGLELWTFVRKWLPGSPWWALDPSKLSSSNVNSNLNTFYGTYSKNFQQRSLPGVTYSNSTPNTTSSFAPDNAGRYPRYADDHPKESMQGKLMYKQYNDARDFVAPAGRIITRSIITDFGTSISATDDIIDVIDYNVSAYGGENYKINEITSSVIGYISDRPSIDGTFFICSPRPKEFMESNQPLGNNDAKLFSLMDGNGGPGGSGPFSEVPDGFFFNNNLTLSQSQNGGGSSWVNLPYARQIHGQDMAHPIINATERASSAYGLAEFPTAKNAYVEEGNVEVPIDDVTRLGNSIQFTDTLGPIDFPAEIADANDYSSFAEDSDGNPVGPVAGGGGTVTTELTTSLGGPSWFGPWFTGRILSNTQIHRTYGLDQEPDTDVFFQPLGGFDFGDNQPFDDFPELSSVLARDFYVIDPAYQYQTWEGIGPTATTLGGQFTETTQYGGRTSAGHFGGRSTMPHIQGMPTGLIGKNYTTDPLGLHDVANPTKMVRPSDVFSTPTTEDNVTKIDDPSGNEVPINWLVSQKTGMRFGANSLTAGFASQPQLNASTGIGSYEDANRYNRSFKSSCDHEFGVVFYDKLGRRSFVSPVGSVFVPGFSDEERGSDKGVAAVLLTLIGNPPSWAHKYQIVYGGNKSIERFVQYSTNNAFIEPKSFLDLGTGGPIASTVDSGKIYVSLNMLQHSSLSYAREFGARGEDGSMSIYKFSDGDKLRVISYGEGDNRVYPKDAVFDILEFAFLDPMAAQANPLLEFDFSSATSDRPAEFFGEFVVLKDNPDVPDFSFTSFLSGDPKWSKNVVFEIFSPKKTTGVTTQVYHEIGSVYPVITNASGTPEFSVNPIEIYDGDVFFRPHAVNFNKVGASGAFEDLLAADEDLLDSNNDLLSNFLEASLESSRPTDLFPSEMKKLGRPNVELSDARTIRREAGIIYSDKSSPDSGKLNYSSFNAAVFPYKDLEERFGNINFMDELGGNLFVIQQDRCTVVPVSATMLTNAVGQDQLIASNDILGKERVFSVTAGCDNNPESVVRVDTVFYFVHKSLGKIFRFIEGQGIEEISDANMGAFLRTKFNEAIELSESSNSNDLRIPGGFDPVKEEYLVTILRPSIVDTASSADNVIVYGCTDPDANNFNPDATTNNGTCTFGEDEVEVEDPPRANMTIGSLTDPGIIEGQSGSDTVIHPEELIANRIPLNETVEVASFVISNDGEADGYIESASINNAGAPYGEAFLSWDIPEEAYVLKPGQSAVLKLNVTPTSVPVSGFFETANISFFGNDGTSNFSMRVIGSVFEPEDQQPQPAEVEINFYLGGRLIDQQFAAQNNGVWNVTVDQNNLIRSINNSYSTDSTETASGTKALLELELNFYPSLGIVVTDQDKIEIKGRILDSLDGFEFTEL